MSSERLRDLLSSKKFNEDVDRWHVSELKRVRVQTLEDAAKRCEAMIGHLTESMHKASAVGRVVVAACRQSDIETLERAAKAIRDMKLAPKKEGQ